MKITDYKDWEKVNEIIDSIECEDSFYLAMDELNSGKYNIDVVNVARRERECWNASQYIK